MGCCGGHEAKEGHDANEGGKPNWVQLVAIGIVLMFLLGFLLRM